jgi:hypothetical protein
VTEPLASLLVVQDMLCRALLVAVLCVSIALGVRGTNGLFYGNPTTGAFQFISTNGDGEQEQFADTFVSNPTAVSRAPGGKVLFANVA